MIYWTVVFLYILSWAWAVAKSIVGTPHIEASGFLGDISDNVENALYWAEHPNSLSNEVRIPKGVHILNRTIQVDASHIILDGKGSLLQCAPDFYDTAFHIKGSHGRYKNISINGPFQTGIRFENKS